MAEKKNLTDVFKERKGKAETDAQSGTSAVETLTQSGVPPSRQGKRRLELWLSPDAKKTSETDRYRGGKESGAGDGRCIESAI